MASLLVIPVSQFARPACWFFGQFVGQLAGLSCCQLAGQSCGQLAGLFSFPVFLEVWQAGFLGQLQV